MYAVSVYKQSFKPQVMIKIAQKEIRQQWEGKGVEGEKGK